MSPDVFLGEFAAWPRAFYPGAKQLIGELSRFYRVGCLSNSNPLHWEKFSEELGTMFDITLGSHLLGSVEGRHLICDKEKKNKQNIVFYNQ